MHLLLFNVVENFVVDLRQRQFIVAVHGIVCSMEKFSAEMLIHQPRHSPKMFLLKGRLLILVS